MPDKLIACCLSAAGIAIMAIFWIKGIRTSVYRRRNIALPGAIIAAVGFIAYLVLGDGEMLEYPMRFAHVSVWLMALLGVMMFISNIELMRREGMRPSNMVGTFLGVIIIAGTGVIYLITGVLYRAQLGFLSRFLPLYFYTLLDYCECLMLGMMIMGYIAAKSTPRYDKDYIIILGCSISKTGGLLPLLKGRTNRAVRYAWDQERASGKPLKYVPSGGKGADEVMSEGSAMELYLLAHGAEPYEVMPERQSTSTAENLAFSKKLIDEAMPGAKVAFSTTNYHVLRSGILARGIGLDAEGIASSTKWYFWPNGFAREVAAMFAMSKKSHLIAAAGLAVICALLSV